ncbi:MAG: alpha/beta fold hydrolase [Anaerolineales bacterium]|nr:alpha/beta fold hydrolase [Anaerolineales bacterium]
MAGLKLFLLGPPRVELNGAPVEIQRRKALAMLVYLAVSGQTHSRDSLATFFWPDLDQQRGRAYLRRDLAVLNTSLPGAWLSADRETLDLNREAGLWVDTAQFSALLAACREHSHAPEIVCAECVTRLTEATALYTGDFLAGFTLRDSPEFDDWQFFQTESLRQELAIALERLVRGLNTQGKAEAAIPHARRWVALDPLHEPAQYQLIQMYDQAGQPAAALRQYEEYVKLLEEELGLPPEEETTTLYEAIKAKRIFAPFIKAEEQRSKKAAERKKAGTQKLPSAPTEAPATESSRAAAGAPTLTGDDLTSARRESARATATPPSLAQQIRYCRTTDGVRLAYATVGQGPPLVKAANWLSHLEYDWQSPVWRHWLEGLTRQHTLVRYDERGSGLSDWQVDDFSFETWVQDLETVVEAAGLERFPLLGLSQGGPIAIAYAVRHPEKVSHLILYGSYARGRLKRNLSPQQLEEVQTFLQLIKIGWGQENPAFRQVFTTLFMPDASLEQQHWFNDLQRMSASPENAMRIVAGFNTIDVRNLAAQVKAPTLVLHARSDARIPFDEGELVASLIPGARFVPLESKNHILLEHEPAWLQFLDEVHQFLGVESVEPSNRTILPTPPLTSRPDSTVPTLPHYLSSPTMPFVGREREYTQLVERLRSIESRSGYVVLLEGEPGIGKSRLVEEVVRTAQNQGVVVLLSKCYEIEQRVPYQTVIDLVYQALSGCPSGTFQHLPASTLAELAFLVPEIEQVFPNLPALPTGLDQVRQARLFRTLQQFLTAAAGQKGLMLVVDDLHWADEVTLQFLPYLARHIANEPVMLIGTFRSEEAAANEQLSAYLHSLLGEPHSLHITLNRLSLEDAGALVASLSAPASQAAELGQWLYHETEGNPLFLISILQSLQEQNILKEDDHQFWQVDLQRLRTAPSELTLPEALREAVHNRLRRISKQARTLLEIAAVYGRRFDLPLLSAVTAESELSLLDLVEDLTTRQLLREDEDDHYDFFHDKIREVAYHDLSTTRCRLLHRRVAEVLEARGNHPPGALAEHFEKGQTWDKAITYLALAAEQARKLFAMPEALHFYDRARALTEQYPSAANQRVALDLYEQRGKARGLVGGMADEAIGDLAVVLKAARAAGEPDKERDLFIHMGQVYRRVDLYESALYYLEEGLKLARQQGDQQSVVDALYHIGTVAWSQGYNDRALIYHQEAVDICRQLGLTNLVAVQALHGLGEARWLSGDAKGAIELYEESLNLARQIQDKSYECENLDNIGYASQGLHGVADYQRAEQILKEGLEISRAAHLDWHYVIALAHLALNHASEGDFQQAITFINQSIALTETIGAKRLQSTYTWARGFLWLELNLLERAKADHTQAIALAQQTQAGDWLPRLQADFAISQLRLGHLGVEPELQGALANALRHRMEIHATRCLEGLAELALARGEPQQALAYTEQLWELAERHDLREIKARALHWRGMALLRLDQLETAATTLQQALEMAEGYGRIRLVWQLHAALADLYRAQKQEEKAAAHEMQVQQIVRRIAANLQEAEFRAGLPLTGQPPAG